MHPSLYWAKCRLANNTKSKEKQHENIRWMMREEVAKVSYIIGENKDNVGRTRFFVSNACGRSCGTSGHKIGFCLEAATVLNWVDTSTRRNRKK